MEANFEKSDVSKLQTNKGFIMYSLRVFQMFTSLMLAKTKASPKKEAFLANFGHFC